MNDLYCQDPRAVLDHFDTWWAHGKTGRPLLYVVSENGQEADTPAFPSVEARYLDVDRKVQAYRAYCGTHAFLGDAYPALSLDLGPGSMALYLGGEPVFVEDTVWFREKLDSAAAFRLLDYDKDNRWLALHLDMIRRAKALAGDDFLINIPDIIENLDILSALRGPQNLCYDLVDDIESVREGVERINRLYFQYYDAFYDLVKGEGGSSSVSYFRLWGTGKTAKLQCDFSALISPKDYRTLVQPSIREQCLKLDHTLYHLDGPDAVKHLDALMEIKELDALQWTSGAGQPDAACQRWYPIYDKVGKAGKSLWLEVTDGGPEEWYKGARQLVSHYGADSLYLLFPEFRDVRVARDFANAFGS